MVKTSSCERKAKRGLARVAHQATLLRAAQLAAAERTPCGGGLHATLLDARATNGPW